MMTGPHITPEDGLVLLAVAYIASDAATHLLARMPDQDLAVTLAAFLWPMLALAEPFGPLYAKAWNRLAADPVLGS